MNPTLPLSSIHVGDRYRKDYGDLSDLTESIPRVGLIHPLILRLNGEGTYELVAGGRRHAALLELGVTDLHYGVTCRPGQPGFLFQEDVNEEQKLEIELEENIRRKDTTWQENVIQVAKVHAMKVRRNALEGKTWGQMMTGEMLGMSAGSVNHALRAARELNTNPDSPLWAMESLIDSIRYYKRQVEDEATRMLAKMSTQPVAPATPPSFPLKDETTGKPYRIDSDTGGEVIRVYEHEDDQDAPIISLSSALINGDCLHFMGACAAAGRTFNHIITDPPYAIDVDYMQQAAGMKDIDRIRDTHQVEPNLQLLHDFAPLAFKVIDDRGFLALWCDQMLWQFLYDRMVEVGFRVQRWPVVWNKTGGLNQSAQFNYTKATEIAMICRKPNATLARTAATNHFLSGITAEEKQRYNHPFTKPERAWRFLFDTIATPGQTIYEPFAGCGSAVIPMLTCGYKVTATELDPTHFSNLVLNVQDHYRSVLGEKVKFI